MNKHRIFYAILLLLFPLCLHGQALEGHIFEKDKNGKKQPLYNAKVMWKGTQAGTLSDEKGYFRLNMSDSIFSQLITSYTGLINDTVSVLGQQGVEIVLSRAFEAKTVVVEAEKKASYISKYSVENMQVIGGKELLRAACCNLSESFETNPSVDVNFADAVTGAKQIRMLGLEGVYTQILKENTPAFRGLANTYGLSYLPGPWIESIQITKGAGSVINGYESMAGQINAELKKPLNSDPLFINLYADQMGRSELNINLSRKLNEKLGSALLLHGDENLLKADRNKDGFLDIPLSRQFDFMNRWEYFDGKKIESQVGISGIFQERQGGQLNFNPANDKLSHTVYGTGLNTNRWEGFAKLGLIFPEKPYKSIGSIFNATLHEQSNYYGIKSYNGKEQSFYANIIYQSIIDNANNKFKTGFSFFDNSLSEFIKPDSVEINLKRKEIVPGVFLEYTYLYKEKFSAIIGGRVDYHNLYGLMLSPRIHAKYNLAKNTILRASAGKGYRTPYIYTENPAIWVSSRRLVIENPVQQEISWNYGGSMMQSFTIGGKEANVNIDFYRTVFEKQMIADLERSPQYIYIYSLKGQSYANSLQAEFNYTPAKNFTILVAWKNYDVRSTYDGKLLQKPLVPKQRLLTTLSYATRFKKYVFDGTALWYGMSRLPNTSSNPEQYRMPVNSPSYMLFNLQVTRNFKTWSVYAGSDDIFDYRDKHPIIAANEPFGKYFDASMPWGPIEGRRVYVGLRFKIAQ
jgi:outer membrane receptor for ferrienterochelin and colicins